jgi:hypothetical protein
MEGKTMSETTDQMEAFEAVMDEDRDVLRALSPFDKIAKGLNEALVIARETMCPDHRRYDRGQCGWPYCKCPDNQPETPDPATAGVAMEKAIAAWGIMTSMEFSTDGIEAACWTFHDQMLAALPDPATELARIREGVLRWARELDTYSDLPAQRRTIHALRLAERMRNVVEGGR